MNFAFLFLVLALTQDPVPDTPRPIPPLPRPLPRPPYPLPFQLTPDKVRMPLPVQVVFDERLFAEPNVCKGKQDGNYCGAGRYANVSYWCEAYTPLVRTQCANGCNAANGMCNE